MQIQVLDLLSNKTVVLEVEPDHRLEDVIEAAINALGLPPDYIYSIVHGGKEFGRSHFEKRLIELNIRDGDNIQLIGRPRGGFL